MFPKLIEIGSFFIPTYGVLLALSYLSAILLAVWLGKREGMDGARIFDFGLYVLISALLGAKLMEVLVNWRSFLEHPRSLMGLLRMGGVFYGGFIAVVIVSLWYVRKYHVPGRRLCDLAGVVLPLGMALGRMGCLAAGCCWGAPVPPDSGTWSVVFTNPYAHQFTGVPLDVPLYPAQTYMSLAALVTFGLMWLLYVKRPYYGFVFGWFLIVSGATRFLLEYLRDDPRGFFLGTPFSTSQGVGLLSAAAGIVWLWWAGRLGRKEREGQGAEAAPSAG